VSVLDEGENNVSKMGGKNMVMKGGGGKSDKKKAKKRGSWIG